ncbi:Protein of unknown function Smg [Candidatus Enterovibrio altilux]|uniref:Protein Smg homolog n=1 Tax=Candidatus Enterovibrio altilux TaxID=1927128 RepID=A0A291B8J2_9GAMM|nr:Protein of unknown function Smg [Candidatus Enterovibrio luxaltus]
MTDELLQAGFHQEDIYKTIDWLEKLALLQEDNKTPYVTGNMLTSVRIFTSKEMERLDTESRGFLMLLEQTNVLNPETREMVIDHVMALETQELILNDLKWIVLIVLFNIPNNEYAYNQMEKLLYCTSENEFLH